ncbi:protein FAM72B-like [Dysidea avara]|uniref:protein FAM72B-like n=1 Tax=Dysidea avara TaxID=196820 RepID=UPI0033226587
MTDLNVSVSRLSPHQECALHPSFKWKPVYNLECVFCQSTLCVRGMKAILLADTRVELYSTDLPPSGATVLVEEDYETRHCECRIKDIACALCGNIVGYHVMLPCHPCLKSCNNGHFWMFHSACVQPHERLDHNSNSILLWGSLPTSTQDDQMHSSDNLQWTECCR